MSYKRRNDNDLAGVRLFYHCCNSNSGEGNKRKCCGTKNDDNRCRRCRCKWLYL